MNGHVFSQLDPFNSAVREQYETAFYDAFSSATTNTLVRHLWTWDDARRRLSTRVSYEDQIIYGWRDAGASLLSALAINVRPRAFQSAYFGFKPAERISDEFEVLTFFSTRPNHMALLAKFWAYCIADLQENGLRVGYATAAERLLPMHRRAGWRVIGETRIDGESRYFLTYRIDRPTAAIKPGPSIAKAGSLSSAPRAPRDIEEAFITTLLSGGDTSSMSTRPRDAINTAVERRRTDVKSVLDRPRSAPSPGRPSTMLASDSHLLRPVDECFRRGPARPKRRRSLSKSHTFPTAQEPVSY